MQLKSGEIIKYIDKSDFGIFVKIGSKVEYLDSQSNLVKISRKAERIKDGRVLRISLQNKSRKIIKVLSSVVVDFKLPHGFRPKEILEHGWLQCSEVKYKSLGNPTKQKRIFFRRDQNSFSFDENYGYLSDSIISEWFTVLRLNSSSLIIGAITTADQFSQIFVRKEGKATRVRVTCQFDGLAIQPGEIVKSEKITFLQGEEEKTLKRFAGLVARAMDVKKPKPPIKAMSCSYYWNGNRVTEEIVDKELNAISAMSEKLNIDYIQIDAGYTRHFGDWLDYGKTFPGGMKKLVSRINRLGYKAGIWLSPFAINPATKLFKKHRSWFLRNGKGKIFDSRFSSPFDSLIPGLDFRAVDPTNEEFRKYLKKILGHFLDQGFKLFKIDFMYPVCLSTRYSIPMTRAQALRSGIKLIRETVGEECYVLSAITPLSPIVGLVDSARMGVDTLSPLVCKLPGIRTVINNRMLESNMQENRLRKFFNGVLWANDPDCLVFREGTGIDERLIEEHKRFAVKNNMSLWTGDSIARMSRESEKKLLKFFNKT